MADLSAALTRGAEKTISHTKIAAVIALAAYMHGWRPNEDEILDAYYVVRARVAGEITTAELVREVNEVRLRRQLDETSVALKSRHHKHGSP